MEPEDNAGDHISGLGSITAVGESIEMKQVKSFTEENDTVHNYAISLFSLFHHLACYFESNNFFTILPATLDPIVSVESVYLSIIESSPLDYINNNKQVK